MKKVYILLSILTIISCKQQEEKEEVIASNSNQISISQQDFVNENMLLGKLSEQSFKNSVFANGVIDVPPEKRATLSSLVPGSVTQIAVLIGDKVKKGDILARIKSTTAVNIQQEYLEISEKLHYLKNEYERQQILYKEKITSEKNFLKAKSTYKSNLATYKGLRKKIEMLSVNIADLEEGKITSNINIYAPISGFITKVNISNGMNITETTELLEIINTDHIHLELNVFEKDILKIKKEDEVLFKVPEASNQNFNAKIHLIGTSVTDNKTIKVHAHIDNEKTNFITGMFINAEIIYEKSQKKAVPKSAIFKNGEDYFVIILESNNDNSYQVKKEKVEIGIQDENYTEILNYNNLKGKDILFKGGFMLFN